MGNTRLSVFVQKGITVSADLNELPEPADSGEFLPLDAVACFAEQSRFKLNDAQWKRFLAALNAPPKQRPRLKKLLLKPGVFDGDR